MIFRKLVRLSPLLASLGLAGVSSHWPVRAEEKAPPAAARSAANEVGNFALLDQEGKYHELRKSGDAKVVLLYVTGNGCPIARQGAEKLKHLKHEFAERGVTCLFLNANPQDDRASLRSEALEFQIAFPILKDDSQFVAKSLGVKRTGEAICVDTKTWTVFYRGPIDDQLGQGTKKQKPQHEFLRDALAQFFAGKEVVQSPTPVAGCLISFEKKDGEANAPSYAKEVAPILQAKCVTCHSPGNIAPFAMTSYQKVKGWTQMMREEILSKRMPPWHADPHFGVFTNDRSITPAETQTLLQWIDSGAPRGEGEDLLAAAVPKPPEAWKLGQPDYVVSIPHPVDVPATGTVDYIYQDTASPVTEDVWLRGAMIRPDNRKVVHHVIAFLEYPKGSGRTKEKVFFAGWAPGTEMAFFPEGTGRFLPKGSKFTFQLHYTTMGKPQTDHSELGLYVQKEPPAQEIYTQHIQNKEFNIPPGEANSATFAMHSFKRDTIIYDMSPHMHLRGSWFKYEALYPDGKKETLLSVPKYDFNWQTGYRLASPKRVPAGTWILCTGGFDNSAQNGFNPDPKSRVRDGEQSWEEMFIGFMNVADAPGSKTDKARASLAK